MSVVLLTGGTGTLGSQVLAGLVGADDELRVISRRAGAGTHHADLATGAGLAEAAAGAELVVHAASDTRHFGAADLQQTRNLLSASAQARHFLYVSIVGVDAMRFRYYRRKFACEQELIASGVPHTILRATQFHELLAGGLRGASRLPVAPVPSAWHFQPVAATEVAARVVELLRAEPQGRAPDFGGPEILSLAEIVETWRARHRRPRLTFAVSLPGRISRDFREGRNTCPDQRAGDQTWSRFVAAAESPR